jgi:RNA polymerase sigma-70 factor (ECF subfamily)
MLIQSQEGMMQTPRRGNEIDELVEQAGLSDMVARQQLLESQRARLRRMVAVRIDRRLAARVDPSDIVQEALTDASRHFHDYLRDRPLPFYPWLRRLAWERMIEAQRRHILADRRSVTRERSRCPFGENDSSAALADHLLASQTSPSGHLIREENRRRLLTTLAELSPRDREVLVLRYLEGLAPGEIAAVLGISAGAVMTRHTRALSRLRCLFSDDQNEVAQ